MALTDNQLQRYQHPRLCAVVSEYLLLDARAILAVAGTTVAGLERPRPTTFSADGDQALPPQVRIDLSILTRHHLAGQLCRFWVYLTWIKDIGYDNPVFWRAVKAAEQSSDGRDGASSNKMVMKRKRNHNDNDNENESMYKTRVRTGVHVVSCLLGDVDTLHALLRCVNLPVRSILDIPREYITLAQLKRLVEKVSRRPHGKMIHSAEMKQLMGWTVAARAPLCTVESATSCARPQRSERVRDIVAVPEQAEKQPRMKRRRHCGGSKNKSIVPTDAGRQPRSDRDDKARSSSCRAVLSTDDDQVWTPQRCDFMWLDDGQWREILALCSGRATISPLLLHQLHDTSLGVDVNAHEQRLMLFLHVVVRVVDVVEEKHVASISEAISSLLFNPSRPDASHFEVEMPLLLRFYQYLVLLLIRGSRRSELATWIHDAWSPHLVMALLDRHHDEEDADFVLLSLLLLQYCTPADEDVDDACDWIASYPWFDHVLKQVGRVHEANSAIRATVEAIVQPWRRWRNTPTVVKPDPESIFSSISSGLAIVVDEVALHVRQQQEDLYHNQIDHARATYFTPLVRQVMVQRLMQKCGEAQYSRDVTHHAIHLLDRHYCTMQQLTSNTNTNSSTHVVCEATMWACLGLAVRLQTQWNDWIEHPFDTEQTSIEGCAMKQVRQQELVVSMALEWKLCLPATPMFWLTQLIGHTLQSVVERTSAYQLLDAREFARAAQYVDIMLLLASHLTHRFMAAVAFYIVYERFVVSQLERCALTTITGYSAKEISTAADSIRAATSNVHIHRLQLDSKQQREERNSGDNYVVDYMRQPQYEVETDLLACSTIDVSTPQNMITRQDTPRTAVAQQQPREYTRVKGSKKLGEGTFGEVFRVSDTSAPGQYYAQKRWKKKNVNLCTQWREVAVMRYLTEMKTPFVVPLVDVVCDKNDGRLSIIMPLYPCSLADRCLNRDKKNDPALTPAQIRSFSRQLLTGIRYCHAAGVVHRDLKPENILLGTTEGKQEEQLFIADLGLSRCISQTDQLLTQDVLTVNYTAPEVLYQYSKYTAAVDMWSIGCILVDMLTGARLFEPDSEHQLRYDICRLLGVPPLDQMVCPRACNRAPRTPPEPRKFLLDKCGRLSGMEREHMADLLYQLLQVDFTKRISAANALQHPYFTTAAPCNEPQQTRDATAVHSC